MTNLTIPIPEKTENKLRARALAEGRDLASVALELVEKGLADAAPSPSPQGLSFDEWGRRFDAWVKSHPVVEVDVDHSRESIYQGRGE